MTTDHTANPSPRAPRRLSPVGQGDYTVEARDCMLSIAAEHGFSWETLWNLPENAELKETRRNPNVLFPGDLVKIPDPRPKSESRPVDQQHRFRLKGSARLNLRLLNENGDPRRNEPYTLDVGLRTINGNTDADGCIHVSISPTCKAATLRLQNGREIHQLEIGAMNPIDDLPAIQSRLYNLAFYAGPFDGQLSEATRQALRDFQTKNNLTVTGDPDADTKAKLLQAHGS